MSVTERAVRWLDLDTRHAEIASALTACLGGLWLLQSARTFTTSIGYRVLAEVADERAWAALLVAMGAVQLAALLADHWQARRLAALVAAAVWAFLCVAFWMGNPASLAVPNYAVMCGGCLISFIGAGARR